ncbi:MAG: hypothetical protein HYU66_24275, partial [Armatimonadetes bacterium]|nr:hypothetical protein [Armatimonadota bacterium]
RNRIRFKITNHSIQEGLFADNQASWCFRIHRRTPNGEDVAWQRAGSKDTNEEGVMAEYVVAIVRSEMGYELRTE